MPVGTGRQLYGMPPVDVQLRRTDPVRSQEGVGHPVFVRLEPLDVRPALQHVNLCLPSHA